MPAEMTQEAFVMPATPSQVRYWWLHRLRPNNHALNMPLAWICRGKLDYGLAATALSEIVRRHETLRTTFEVADEKLSQIIRPPFEVPLPVTDLRHLAADTREKQTEQMIQEEAHVRMDLENGPLIFARALRTGNEEHVLLLTIHHSVCDGWSNGVVLRDFAAIYDGLVRRIPANLPELSIQFGDYAVWLEDWRKNQSAESLEYWRKTLGGDFSELRISRDFSDHGAEEKGQIETLLLPGDLAQYARDFCATRGLTMYMLLLAVYGVTLHRLTGQGDFLVGTPCANRRVGTEDLIGPFSNPQVIRIRVQNNDSVASILDQVRDWSLGAVAHQDLPFEDLNEDEFFSWKQNQITLQVYFIYQKAFMQAQRAESLEIVPRRSVSPGALFDLMLSIVERAEGPRLQLEYNPGHFHITTIQGILRLFVEVLKAILSDPAQPAGVSAVVGMSQASLSASAGKEVGADVSVSTAQVSAAKAVENNVARKRNREIVAPRDPLELQVLKIWENTIGCRNLSIRDDFFDIGGRSLAAMRIISQINRIYRVDFGLATLFSGKTIESMAELIRNRLSANTDSSIIPLQPQGTAAPLYIIHGASGNIIRFYQLAMLLGTEHPVYGIQAQSLLARQRALLRLEDLAAYYLADIRKVQPKGPYYFLGYSFGGTTALEMAHQLRALGEEVELLGMLDSRQREYMVQMQQLDSVRTKLGRRIERFLGNLAPLSWSERVGYLWKKLTTRILRWIYSVTLSSGGRSVPSFLRSTDDISWVAAMNYRPRRWPGKITLFRASIQPDPRLPQDLGWTPLAEGGVEVHQLPGDHDLVFQEPNIQVLAEQLRACLEPSNPVEIPVPETITAAN